MCERKGAVQSRKRVSKVLQQEEAWNCSVCTYSNSPEAFKCLMCNVRKGTSTRKPRLNQLIVAQQEATRAMAQSAGDAFKDFLTEEETEEEKEADEEKWKKMSKAESWEKVEKSPVEKKIPRPPKAKSGGADKNVTLAVTVNNQTIMFTEFKTKRLSLDKAKKQPPITTA